MMKVFQWQFVLGFLLCSAFADDNCGEFKILRKQSVQHLNQLTGNYDQAYVTLDGVTIFNSTHETGHLAVLDVQPDSVILSLCKLDHRTHQTFSMRGSFSKSAKTIDWIDGTVWKLVTGSDSPFSAQIAAAQSAFDQSSKAFSCPGDQQSVSSDFFVQTSMNTMIGLINDNNNLLSNVRSSVDSGLNSYLDSLKANFDVLQNVLSLTHPPVDNGGGILEMFLSMISTIAGGIAGIPGVTSAVSGAASALATGATLVSNSVRSTFSQYDGKRIDAYVVLSNAILTLAGTGNGLRQLSTDFFNAAQSASNPTTALLDSQQAALYWLNVFSKLQTPRNAFNMYLGQVMRAAGVNLLLQYGDLEKDSGTFHGFNIDGGNLDSCGVIRTIFLVNNKQCLDLEKSSLPVRTANYWDNGWDNDNFWTAICQCEYDRGDAIEWRPNSVAPNQALDNGPCWNVGKGCSNTRNSCGL